MSNVKISAEATSLLPTRFGDFRLTVFSDHNGNEHLVLAIGNITNGCLVRLHSECATGDIVGSLRCDCRDQLELSLNKIRTSGHGLFIYLRGQEGRGIGLANKIKAYMLQDQGMDTVDANVQLGFAPDQRNYAVAIAILQHYELKQVQLLTNNHTKIKALEQNGIQATQIALWTATNPHNEAYIDTKQKRMGHIGPF